MKGSPYYNMFDLRKLQSHISFCIFSLVVTLILILADKVSSPLYVSFVVFLMLFLQLEVFIYFGNRLFIDIDFNKSPSEITKVIFVRFILFLAGCLFASLILYVATRYLLQFMSGGRLADVYPGLVHSGIRDWFNSTLIGLSIGAVIFIVLQWQSSLKREQMLREENLIFHNETLKNQINPHFLFNSLNTLSSLVSTHPETAEKFIGSLSSIYRYILENSSKDKVQLQIELKFISDYFFLHKIRDENKIELDISVDDHEKHEILPVSLQILVENAIKHNVATRNNPLKICIYQEGDYIVVRNNLQKMGTKLPSTNIGLKNLAQRVRLVTGKVLIVDETGTDFIVKIPLLL